MLISLDNSSFSQIHEQFINLKSLYNWWHKYKTKLSFQWRHDSEALRPFREKKRLSSSKDYKSRWCYLLFGCLPSSIDFYNLLKKRGVFSLETPVEAQLCKVKSLKAMFCFIHEQFNHLKNNKRKKHTHNGEHV